MYPITVQPNEIISMNRQAHLEGFAAGFAVAATLYGMWKLNKETIRTKLNRSRNKTN